MSLNLFSQNEYEVDNDFIGLKSKKEKKKFEGKRKFNIHLSAGYTMSTVFGKDVSILKDTLTNIKNRYNLDSYQVEPNYSPYGHIDFSFNFSKSVSLNMGVKYNNLGWREVAKFTNSSVFYRFKVRYDFHYLSNSIALQFHPNKFVSVYLGQTFSFLIKNEIFIREYQTFNGTVVTDTKERLNFLQATNIRSKTIIPHFFVGTHIGFDRLRLNLNFLYTSKFIRTNIRYDNIAIEAGILFKIFNDYDKKL